MTITFPTELDVLITRAFDAPIGLVFDVLFKEEHVRNTFPPFGEEMKTCSIDLRVGGSYHFVMQTSDGTDMSFRGTFIEIDPPTRVVQTWAYEGWPDTEAVETVDLEENDGVTTMTWRMAFRDEAGRAHMTKYDGIEAGFDNVERYLRSLVG